MTGFFSVTNYESQQHYKDRGPTWIKLYNRLLDDYPFAMLPDAAKWHLIGIFLLASRHNNRIPCDTAWLARQIGAVSPVDLAPMERAGFIARVEEEVTPFCADVAAAFDLFANTASPEKKREEQNREEKNLLSAGADLSGLVEGGAKSGGLHLGELRMSYRKWDTPLLVALIAAGAQILVAVIQAISRWGG